MDQPWDVSYREHAIWDTIEMARDALTETDIPISDPRSVALQELLASIEAHKGSPDILITQVSLDGANLYLSKLREDLPENLDAVFAGSSSPFEQLAAIVRTWPTTASVKLTGLSNRVDELHGIFAASEQAVMAQADEAIATQGKKVSEALSEIANDIAEYRSQLKVRRDLDIEKADSVRDSINEDLEKVSDTLFTASTATTELRERIAAQDQRLDEASIERAEKFAAETADRHSEWEDAKNLLYANMAESRRAMEDAEKESRNVLAKIGVNITSGDYGAYASEQERAANFWRLLATVAFMLAGLLFVGFAVMPLFTGGLQLEWWEYAFQRLGTPVGIAGVAIYMARESALHREQQRMAKQAHLTLSTLEPFIANLPPAERSEIRGETARRLFANSERFNVAGKSGERARVSRVSDRSSGS